MIGLIKKGRDWWLKNIIWHRFTIGKRFHCGRGVFLWAKNEITIGDDFYLGKYSIIETDCRIGNGVIFANNVGVVGRYDHYYQQIGIDCTYELNPGNHFQDPEKRLAKGIAWILQNPER